MCIRDSFRTLCNPVEILDDGAGKVGGIRCVEMELGEPDESGRRRPVEKKGSEFEIEADSVIMAIGTSPNPLIRSTTPGLEANRHGCLITKDESGKTSREGLWAGGDAVTGAASVILAMGAGKQEMCIRDRHTAVFGGRALHRRWRKSIRYLFRSFVPR